MKTALIALCALSLLCLSTTGQSVVETRNGGAAYRAAIIVKTSTYTAGSDDYTILVDATSAAVTVNLPGSEKGRVYVIKKIDDSANAVTINPAGSETVDGATTLVLPIRYSTAQIQRNIVSGTKSWQRLNVTRATDLTENVTATNVITPAESGSTFFLNSSTEFVSTLPAPAAGLHFTFIVTAAPSGASYTVVTTSSANIIKGQASIAADAAGDTGTADDTVSFVDGQAVAGDMIEVWCDGTSWLVKGRAAVAAGLTFTQAS